MNPSQQSSSSVATDLPAIPSSVHLPAANVPPPMQPSMQHDDTSRICAVMECDMSNDIVFCSDCNRHVCSYMHAPHIRHDLLQFKYKSLAEVAVPTVNSKYNTSNVMK